MDISDFFASLTYDTPPSGISAALEALWFASNNRWAEAHKVVQDQADQDSSLVHACIHRREGDLWNARYWYKRASRKPSSGSSEDEVRSIIEELLSRSELRTHGDGHNSRGDRERQESKSSY